MPGPGPSPTSIENALRSLQTQIDRTARRPSGTGAGESRVMYLYDPTLGYATQTSIFLLSQAQENGYQDTSGTFAMVSGEVLTVGAEYPIGGPGPDFTDLTIRVTKIADSNGIPLSSGSKIVEETSTTISRSSMTVTETGVHTGALFHTTSGAMDLTFDVAGWFQIYAFLTWA